MIDINSLSRSMKQILQVLALNFSEKGLKASDITALTAFSRQMVYKDLRELDRWGLVKSEDVRGVLRYDLARNDLKLYFLAKAGEKKALSSVDGRLLNSYKIRSSCRPVFYDPLWLPRDNIYGCSVFLESIPTSHFSLFQRLQENLSETHNSLGEMHWTVIDAYNVDEPHLCRIGVGLSPLLKTLAEHKKAAVKIVFGVQDFLGEFVFNTYYLEARLFNGVLDQIRLTILTQKIPIGKKFVVGWNRIGFLPYVEPFEVEMQNLFSEHETTTNSSSLTAFTYDPRLKRKSISDVILKIPHRSLHPDIPILMAAVMPGSIDDIIKTKSRSKRIIIDAAYRYAAKAKVSSTPLISFPQIYCAHARVD